MSRPIPMSDLVADDLLLDRLAAREPVGSDPVAGLLSALAEQADTPLPSRTGRRRIGHKHRYLGPLAALAVAASGAGVAAAVSLPHHAPDPAEKARIVRQMEAAARSGAPSALLSRLGLPRTSGTTAAEGLVMARRGDGVIVLVPASAVAGQASASAAAGTPDGSAPGAARDSAPGQGGEQGGDAGPAGGQDGSPSADSTQGGTGTGQGSPEQGSGTSSAPTGSHAVAPQPRSTGHKQGDGGQGSGSQGSGSGSGSAGSRTGKGGQPPTTGSTPTATPSAGAGRTGTTLSPEPSPDTMLVSTASPTTPPTP